MLSAIDVANFFIDAAAKDQNGDCMTNLRLQKLLYLSQAWYLARHHKPLFEDEIEAWQYGPVVPNVYHHYAGYGRNQIQSADDGYDISAFGHEELTLLLDILAEYDRYSTLALVDHLHDHVLWQKHYKLNRGIIPIKEIDSHFSSLDEQLLSLDDMLKKMPVDPGRIAENGALVFETE